MTTTEKRYMKEIVENNKRMIREIESGELWADIYKTPEQRLAVIQGLNLANEPFERFSETYGNHIRQNQKS